MSRASQIATLKGHLARRGTTLDVVHIWAVGDSLVAGVSTGADNGQSLLGTSWHAFGNGVDKKAEPMAKATTGPQVGKWSMIWAFAQELYARAGIRTVITAAAKGGTPILRESGANNWDFRLPLPSNNMLTLTNYQGENRAAIVPQSIAMREKICGIRVVDTWVISCDGMSEDGPRITSDPTVATQITANYRAMFDFFAERVGASRLYLMLPTIQGANITEASSKEAEYEKAAARSAFRAAENDNIFVMFGAVTDPGTPYGTLTVDANGLWQSGIEFRSDGVHWSEAFADCVGRTSAHNVLVREGRISGSYIGRDTPAFPPR